MDPALTRQRYLLVDKEYCCGYSLLVDTSTWTNVTPSLLTLAHQSRAGAWLTCQDSSGFGEVTNATTGSGGGGGGIDKETFYNVQNLTLYDLRNVTTQWQSREDLLKDYLGDRHISLEAVVLLTALYTLIFLSGVLGNVCTCIVIARNRSMHTATNYYLFSLAVSDVLTLLLGELICLLVCLFVHTRWFAYYLYLLPLLSRCL